jgi:acylphosphatase
MVRVTCFLSGRVQGVGMRYAIHRLVSQSPSQVPLAGYVENMEDGRVRLVVEGPVEAIDALLERIQTEGPGVVRTMDRFESPATSEFRDFEIRR